MNSFKQGLRVYVKIYRVRNLERRNQSPPLPSLRRPQKKEKKAGDPV